MKRDWQNLNKTKLAQKIVRDLCSSDIAPMLFDFDMSNLFPPREPLENMEEAGSGAYETLPRNTLRERSYGKMPLIIKPQYSGDFLEKLKEPIEGKPIEAADPTNLLDFSMPEEWLKHQEEPVPRVLLDDYYEVAKPGKPVDQILKEYWDRGWDTNDSPEISEDKWLRTGPPIDESTEDVPFRTASRIVTSFLLDAYFDNCPGPCSDTVVAHYLMGRFPIYSILNFGSNRVAKLLSDFEHALITTSKGTRKPDVGGVTVRLKRAEPRVARWTFRTTSGKTDPYTTIFQFLPQSTVRDLTKLNVRVSCSCPSFLFWGAQYHAVMGDYLYGAIRPKYAPPKIRDPHGTFLVCKHVLACIPVVSKYLLGVIPKGLKEKIQKEPKFKIEKRVPEEKLRIPKEYIQVGRRENIKDIAREWDERPQMRKKWVMGLEDPEEVIYLAHRFPETATHFVAERLKQLARNPETKKEALELLKEVSKIEEKVPPEVKIPSDLKKYDIEPSVQEFLKEWESKKEGPRRRAVMSETDPDRLAYLAFKMNHEPEMVSAVMERLTDIAKDEKRVEGEQEKAKDWLKIII